MKNIKVLNIIFAILFTIQLGAIAIQPKNIEMQENINTTKRQISNTQTQQIENFTKQIEELTNRYYNNLKTCVPVHYNQNMDIFGLKINFQIDINGWNRNNKCEYYMTGNIGGIGKDIKETFNVDINEEKLAKIKPIIQCNFSKQQLEIIGNAIIARNQNNTTYIKKLLSDPKEIQQITDQKSTLTKEEEELLKMLINNNSCSILNFEEIMNNLSDLMGIPIKQGPQKK